MKPTIKSKPKRLMVELPTGFPQEAKHFDMEPVALASRVLEAFVREKRDSVRIGRRK